MVLELNKKRKVKRKICNGQEIEIIPYATIEQVNDILDRVAKGTYDRLGDGESPEFAISTAYMTMNVCLIYYLTNVENGVDDYEKMVESGVINTICDAVVNYEQIQSMVNSVVQMVFMSTIIPNVNSVSADIERMEKFVNNMNETQKENLNAIINAGMANAIMNKIKDKKGELEK